MEEMTRFVMQAQSDRFTITELCEKFGISRKTSHIHLATTRRSGSKARGAFLRWLDGISDWRLPGAPGERSASQFPGFCLVGAWTAAHIARFP